MTAMNLRFAFEKETKGAVRFQEVGEDGIQSAPHGSNNPRHTALKRLVVTIPRKFDDKIRRNFQT
jgi:hypothetical protein